VNLYLINYIWEL